MPQQSPVQSVPTHLLSFVVDSSATVRTYRTVFKKKKARSIPFTDHRQLALLSWLNGISRYGESILFLLPVLRTALNCLEPPLPWENYHHIPGRVAKAGAAACAQCGGAGGGSEWAKSFAVDLCQIFDCPSSVQREVRYRYRYCYRARHKYTYIVCGARFRGPLCSMRFVSYFS